MSTVARFSRPKDLGGRTGSGLLVEGWLHRDYIGKLEKKMETTFLVYWSNIRVL